MSYLVCNKCGSYYELQKGESPADFVDKCECGGSLKYVQNLDEHVFDELDPMNGINICPNCGKENKADINFCNNCGQDLYSEITEPHDGLIKLGYILAVIGPFLLFTGTIAAIIIGLILYGKENPRDRRSGKYIVIIAIIIAIIVLMLLAFILPALIIYNSYFDSQSFDTYSDINTTRTRMSAFTFLLNKHF